MHYQTVPLSLWTRSTFDPHYFVFQNTGTTLTIVWHENGGLTMPQPERWRVVRADPEYELWIAVPTAMPSSETLRACRERWIEEKTERELAGPGDHHRRLTRG